MNQYQVGPDPTYRCGGKTYGQAWLHSGDVVGWDGEVDGEGDAIVYDDGDAHVSVDPRHLTFVDSDEPPF